MSMNSMLKKNVRRVSAMLAGFAMAATLTGLTVAGAASAAPASDTAAPAAAPIYFGAYMFKSDCLEVARQYEEEVHSDINAWCVRGNNDGRIVWKGYYEFV
jgi:hypothetical protein